MSFSINALMPLAGAIVAVAVAVGAVASADAAIPGYTLGAADFGAISSARAPRTLQIGTRFHF